MPSIMDRSPQHQRMMMIIARSPLVCVILLVFPATAAAQMAADPYAHYDASVVDSIRFGPPPAGGGVPLPYTDAVVQWDDQTANGFHAGPPGTLNGGDRHPVYPEPLGYTFSSGMIGIDFSSAAVPDENQIPRGGNGAALPLLEAGSPQDGLLDFSVGGSASAKSGFSVYLVYHVDEHDTSETGQFPGILGKDFNYVLGNSEFPNNDGPAIWFNKNADDGSEGDPEIGVLWAGLSESDGLGATNNAIAGGTTLMGQETIISFNYDAASGDFTIANANADGVGDGSVIGNEPAGNFTSFDGQPLVIGSSPNWANFRADGDFGELVIYDRFIDPSGSEHSDTISFLQQKWFAAPGLVGDYNNDGVVDAADYAVWRDNLNTDNALPNDPIGGTITQAQYDQWKANYSASSGFASTSSVPEPSGGLLLMTGLCILFAAARSVASGSLLNL